MGIGAFAGIVGAVQEATSAAVVLACIVVCAIALAVLA